MAGLDFGSLGGIGLGITQGMYDRQADVQTRMDRLKLQQAKEEQETDTAVKANLKRAAEARTSRRAGIQQEPAAQVQPAVDSAPPAQAGVQPPAAAQPAAPAANPAAQSSIGPQAGAAPVPQGNPGAVAPRATNNPQFDPDLQLEQAQIMMESGNPKWMALGQQMAQGAITLRSAKRRDEAEAGMYQALQAQNSLIDSFHDKESGTTNALGFLTGPGQAYMNRVNYNGQNYQIMQDGKGGMVAVAHDPSGKITAQIPVDKNNVVPLATSVAQAQTLNVLGRSSPDMMLKLFENNIRQQQADASTTSAQSSWKNAETHERDTQAKLDADVYGAQAGQARASGQAALMQGTAALLNARSMERYRQSQMEKIESQIDAKVAKLPEEQKLILQQLKSNADIATKATLADPQNQQAAVAAKASQLKLAQQYTKLNLIPAGTEFEFAGIPSPADAAARIMSDNPKPEQIRQNLMGASIYGQDYAKQIEAEIMKLRRGQPEPTKATPGIRRSSTPKSPGNLDQILSTIRDRRQGARPEGASGNY